VQAFINGRIGAVLVLQDEEALPNHPRPRQVAAATRGHRKKRLAALLWPAMLS
jgi:hypothetical protein